MKTYQNLSFPSFPSFQKQSLLLLLSAFLLFSFGLSAQIELAGNTGRSVEDCPAPCPCSGNFTQMQLYYFGEDNVTIDVYRNSSLSILITTFNNVVSGQLLTVSGAATLNGTLGNSTYFQITNAAEETCVEQIYSKCPTNAWPGSSDDLDVLGKTYGDFTVFSRTDIGNNYVCDLSNADQDWHVGGNVVSPIKNTMGTRNDESVVFISNDIDRGTITNNGDFGINTLAPAARLDVQGDAIINETLDVNGIARMNDLSPSTSSADGALIVAGGAGIGENLNVAVDTRTGQDLAVGRDAAIGRDLDVVNDAAIGNDATVGNNLDVSNNATVGVDALIGQNLSVGNDAVITNDAAVGNNLDVANNANVSANAAVGQNLMVSGNTSVGLNLSVSNDAHVNGVVTIGTNNTPNQLGTVNTTGYQLFVNGGILTEEVLVRTGWADYVFEKGYHLLPLETVAAHISTYGHLPNTPSAEEIETNGLSLGNTAVLQQEKIEELFLHLIEMNEAIKTLKAANQALQVQLDELKK